MHMSDALISPQVAGTFYLFSAGLVAFASKKLTKDPHFSERLPLAGVLGAFVFSAQMINFAIPGTGSSGHIGGGLLLAAILGPYAAVVAMACILLVQCLLFADGGLLALGCNIFNLAFWPAFVGFPLYMLIKKVGSTKAIALAASLAAVVVSLEAGAFSVVIETILSGRSELSFGTFSAFMLGIHLPIAIVEGLLTLAVLSLYSNISERVSLSTIAPQAASKRASMAFLAVAIFVGTIGAWFASAKPDGLEWSLLKITGAEELKENGSRLAETFKGVQEKTALLPDYNLPVVSKENENIGQEEEASWPQVNAGTSFSGAIGAFVTAILIICLGSIVRIVKPLKGTDA